MPQKRLQEVTKQNPCPHCGYLEWITKTELLTTSCLCYLADYDDTDYPISVYMV